MRRYGEYDPRDPGTVLLTTLCVLVAVLAIFLCCCILAMNW